MYQLYWRGQETALTASSLDDALALLGEIVGVNGVRDLTAIRYADGSHTVAATATGNLLDWSIQEECPD